MGSASESQALQSSQRSLRALEEELGRKWQQDMLVSIKLDNVGKGVVELSCTYTTTKRNQAIGIPMGAMCLAGHSLIFHEAVRQGIRIPQIALLRYEGGPLVATSTRSFRVTATFDSGLHTLLEQPPVIRGNDQELIVRATLIERGETLGTMYQVYTIT